MDILHVSTPPFLHSLSLSVSADSKWRKAGFSPGALYEIDHCEVLVAVIYAYIYIYYVLYVTCHV